MHDERIEIGTFASSDGLGRNVAVTPLGPALPPVPLIAVSYTI
jgi:hypothetical protein